MTAAAPKKTSRDRERLRAKGLKPVTLWLPDVDDPEFIPQMRRECRLISESPHEKEIMEWIDGVRYWPPDEPHMPDYSESGPKEE
jgi:hypothetical protein